MLVKFRPLFVVDKKIIFSLNFGAYLRRVKAIQVHLFAEITRFNFLTQTRRESLNYNLAKYKSIPRINKGIHASWSYYHHGRKNTIRSNLEGGFSNKIKSYQQFCVFTKSSLLAALFINFENVLY